MQLIDNPLRIGVLHLVFKKKIHAMEADRFVFKLVIRSVILVNAIDARIAVCFMGNGVMRRKCWRNMLLNKCR